MSLLIKMKLYSIKHLQFCKRHQFSSTITSIKTTKIDDGKDRPLILGCVAYCDGISSIWQGMKDYFNRKGVNLDFITFTTYERQIEFLLNGKIDIAWNGPLAHCRFKKIVKQLYNNRDIISLGMRDVDRDFQSYIITTKLSNIKTIKDLENKRLAVGTFDSPQAFIMPMYYLQSQKVDLSTIDVIRYDNDIGKHGDTAIGEINVIEALRNGSVDAGFVSKMMFDRRDRNAIGEDNLNIIGIKSDTAADTVTTTTTNSSTTTTNSNSNTTSTNSNSSEMMDSGIFPVPVFDHCQFDAMPTLNPTKLQQFQQFRLALTQMDWSNVADAKTMKSEGIDKCWVDTREEGYRKMQLAIENESLVINPLDSLYSPNQFKSLTIVVS